MKTKPLISYYGGKQRLASKIVKVLDKIPHKCYCEPFFGGGAVLFAKERKGGNNDNNIEAVNDISGLLMNMYRIAINYRNEFTEYCQSLPHAKPLHTEFNDLLKPYTSKTGVEIEKLPFELRFKLACAFWYFVNNNFGKRLFANSFGYGKVRNQATVYASHQINLPYTIDRLIGVSIFSEDVFKFCKRFNGKDTVYYLDPPYIGSNTDYYFKYSEQDYKDLINFLNNINASYILSNYQQDLEPRHQYLVKFSTWCTASKNTGEEFNESRKRVEYLYCYNAHDDGEWLEGIDFGNTATKIEIIRNTDKK
jgi:DNA adenine methylase